MSRSTGGRSGSKADSLRSSKKTVEKMEVWRREEVSHSNAGRRGSVFPEFPVGRIRCGGGGCPYMARGLSSTVKLRLETLWNAAKRARFRPVLRRFRTQCPYCRRDEELEMVQHFLLYRARCGVKGDSGYRRSCSAVERVSLEVSSRVMPDWKSRSSLSSGLSAKHREFHLPPRIYWPEW